MFKHLVPFRLGANSATVESIAADLEAARFVPCGANDAQSAGWAPHPDGSFVYAVAGHLFLSYKVEKKLLPGGVIAKALQKKVDKVAERSGRPVGKKLRRMLKDEVIAELLPKAFSQDKTYWVWLDPKDGWMGVICSSRAFGEEVIQALNRTLKTRLPIALIKVQSSPSQAMADWLAVDEAPGGFVIADQCELVDPDESKGTVRYAHHHLDGDEVKQNLAVGKLATKLALTFEEELSFVLTSRFELKSVKFLASKSEDHASAGDGKDDELDAKLLYMGSGFARALKALVDELGEAEEEA